MKHINRPHESKYRYTVMLLLEYVFLNFVITLNIFVGTTRHEN